MVVFSSYGAGGSLPFRAGVVVRMRDTLTGPFVEIKIADTKKHITVRASRVKPQN